MQINNNGVSQTSLNAANQLGGAASSPREMPGVDSDGDSDGYKPSAELTRLVDLAKREPQIRADRIQQVAENLKSGVYFSDASATAAATAMLNALD
jgi:hypothetical protein